MMASSTTTRLARPERGLGTAAVRASPRPCADTNPKSQGLASCPAAARVGNCSWGMEAMDTEPAGSS
eukprot:2862480-Prymnesium_polylepis.1